MSFQFFRKVAFANVDLYHLPKQNSGKYLKLPNEFSLNHISIDRKKIPTLYSIYKIFFCLGFWYKTIIESKSQTCSNSGENKIYSKGYFSKKECERKCDAVEDCMFAAQWKSGWCALYKSCTNLRSTKKLASTFKKVKSKFIANYQITKDHMIILEAKI